MADSLRSTTPVSGAGGFAGRAPARHDRHEPPAAAVTQRAPDRVHVEDDTALARRVLRERVLARTRQGLELDDNEHGPTFAEVIDREPVSQFLGRLLSAQNQLAARRLPSWGNLRVRMALDAALRSGAAEAVEMLAAAGSGAVAAVAVVADVLAEYGRRLASLVDEVEPKT